MISRKRILITGGAGFIGPNLCDRLVRDGHYIICLDNLYTGSKDNIEHLLEFPNFEFIVHDVVTPFNCKVDEIYNLACPASPYYYQLDPIKTTTTSVVGAINMLDLAVKNNAKLLQASTSEVYGDPLVHPQKEDYWGNVNPVGIRSCYDEGKRCAETLCIDYSIQKKAKIKIVRIFNTYGPRMMPNDGRVVSNFIVAALKKEDLEIYGEGDQTRSFQYIDDLLDGMIKMMATGDEFTGPVNLGNPNEFKISELAQMVVDMNETNSNIIYKPLPGDDPKRRRPDITLAKEVLNWEPSIVLSEGLAKTIEYFRNKVR